MITEVLEVDDRGREHINYFGKKKHVVDNGNGTYSIPAVTNMRDSYCFYTKDDPNVYMYDEEDRVWWKQ